ncbi:MAG: hypothetical protein ACTS6P_02105 [Candidatus Hodgkinia cicadicola]
MERAINSSEVNNLNNRTRSLPKSFTNTIADAIEASKCKTLTCKSINFIYP